MTCPCGQNNCTCSVCTDCTCRPKQTPKRLRAVIGLLAVAALSSAAQAASTMTSSDWSARADMSRIAIGETGPRYDGPVGGWISTIKTGPSLMPIRGPIRNPITRPVEGPVTEGAARAAASAGFKGVPGRSVIPGVKPIFLDPVRPPLSAEKDPRVSKPEGPSIGLPVQPDRVARPEVAPRVPATGATPVTLPSGIGQTTNTVGNHR